MDSNYFQRSDYLNSRVKYMLIDSFVKRDGLDLSFSNSSCKCEETSFEKPSLVDLNSSEILSSVPPLIKSEDPTRPNSSCSQKSSTFQTSKCHDPSLSDTYHMAITNLSSKTLKSLEKYPNNDNLECLLYSFLILYTSIKGNSDMLKGIVLMRSKAYVIFKNFLTAPDKLIKNIKLIPRIIRQKRLGLSDLKKSLAWFNMVSSENLGAFIYVYDFIKETLAYSRKFYCVSLVFNEYKLPLGNKDNKLLNCVEKNHLYSKNLGKMNEVVGRLNESIEEVNENTLRPPQSAKRPLKNPKLCMFTNKLKEKNTVFLMSSRIVQKNKEGFAKFWVKNEGKYKNVTENKIKQVLDVFQDFQAWAGYEITGEGAKIVQQDIAAKLAE
ncbi:hypothetical protein SteCoe_36589 [Stentor coeruleus]|uniref:Uncharacterized protein n=1 Tax=Stentor coeruleus TaxID=5963 RepID=A0A1R2APT1_9CILI|nr:hypothetical protein SteCoe_36589 [Stentor coeruleus]